MKKINISLSQHFVVAKNISSEVREIVAAAIWDGVWTPTAGNVHELVVAALRRKVAP